MILGLLTVAANMIAAIIGRKFGTKESPVIHNTSYGQGGSAGPNGQGGAGGNVAHIQGFPLMPGTYDIKVGKGGAPGEPGEASSITTPTGSVFRVVGGEGAKETTRPSENSPRE